MAAPRVQIFHSFANFWFFSRVLLKFFLPFCAILGIFDLKFCVCYFVSFFPSLTGHGLFVGCSQNCEMYWVSLAVMWACPGEDGEKVWGMWHAGWCT